MKHNKLTLFGLGLILLIGFSTLALKAPSGYNIGDKATDFSLMGTDDKMHGLSEFEDANGYIVIFTCNHCPYSKAYEDRIIELQTEFGPQGYPVIAINPNDPEVNADDDFPAMKVRAKEKGFNFPYLFDDGQKVYPQYGATRTPHVYLLDKNRIVKYIGAIDDNTYNADEVEQHFVKDAIAKLQAGENPDPATTKAIGCSIKVKK